MKTNALVVILTLIAGAALPAAAHAQRMPYGAPITLDQAKKVLASRH